VPPASVEWLVPQDSCHGRWFAWPCFLGSVCGFAREKVAQHAPPTHALPLVVFLLGLAWRRRRFQRLASQPPHQLSAQPLRRTYPSATCSTSPRRRLARETAAHGFGEPKTPPVIAVAAIARSNGGRKTLGEMSLGIVVVSSLMSNSSSSNGQQYSLFHQTLAKDNKHAIVVRFPIARQLYRVDGSSHKRPLLVATITSQSELMDMPGNKVPRQTCIFACAVIKWRLHSLKLAVRNSARTLTKSNTNYLATESRKHSHILAGV
jgi:hypothetical protein